MGDIHEPFLGFADFSNDHRAQALADKNCRCLRVWEKIGVQKLWWCSVMSGHKAGLQYIASYLQTCHIF